MAHLRCDIKSQTLGMTTSLEVVLPDEGSLQDAKVVYLLHGLSDNCSGWCRYSAVERYAFNHGAAVVVPEVQRSFYTDMALGLDYFTYVSRELPQLCTHYFGLGSRREQTYVMGLSMGGYGALKCALTDPSRYAACASFSAVTDIRRRARQCPDNQGEDEFRAIFGPRMEIPAPSSLFDLLEGREAAELPEFFLTCGEQDSLYEENCRFVRALEEKGAAAEFRHWPGDHSWDLWDKSVCLAFDRFL